jgi:peptide/nickel transport system ATP-binding protein
MNLPSGAILEVDRLDVSYLGRRGRVDAVVGMAFAIDPGQRLGLVGESGSGKTTLALAVMGLLRPPGRVTSGAIRLEGADIVGLDARAQAALRLARIGYVPQGAMNALNPVLRIHQSIAHAIRAHGGAAGRDRIVALLGEVGLAPEVADRYPHELSGGMKQRICIAIAISLGPALIIADEPTSALDVVTQRQVMQTLRRVQERRRSALLLIGHDMGLMAQSVDAVVVMRQGRLVEHGDTRQMFGDPAQPYTRELISSVPVVGGGARHQGARQTIAATPLLQCDGIEKTYGGGWLGKPATTALHRLTFTLAAAPPRIVAVVGQSGSGKTTLGNLVLGTDRPSSGRVLFEGHDIATLRGARAREFRRAVQAIFQDPFSSFNPFYRVSRSLAVPLRSFRIAKSPADARAKMEAACRQVGLDPALLDRFAHQLSGGQRQRLMVARALLLRPRLLVADEPVSMVDASLRAAILDLLVELRDAHGISILYITHDLATAWRVSDEVLVLHQGRVVEAGDPAAVFEQPEHPYTRLLIDCLPWPDPARPWGQPGDEAEWQAAVAARAGEPPILREAADRVGVRS